MHRDSPDADTYGMKRLLQRLRSDDGFTLVESIVALTVMTIAIVLTIAPVLTGFNVLSDSKLTTIASNLAQARVEELRSLAYEQIGYPSGLPEGILQASETVTVQGIDFVVATDVKYFGSINPGDDVIPQGGDGVEGLMDTGIDYKEVVVTVSHHANAVSPVVMETIVAPPNIAAHEGKANVIVDLVKTEPTGKPASPAAYPQVTLVKDTAFIPYPGVPEQSQVFAGVSANESSAPDFYYYARLGATVTSFENSGWWIHPQDIDIESDRVHLGPTETATVALRIYRPAEIEVQLRDQDEGDPITGNAALVLSYETGSTTFSSASPEWTGDGWYITELDGMPVVPGVYAFNVGADGYLAQTAADVVVPSDYPNDPYHLETFFLEPTDGSQVIVTVVDELSAPISGAEVTFSDYPGGPVTLATDLNGVVSYFFDSAVSDVDWEVISDSHDPSGKDNRVLNDPVEYIDVTLATAVDAGLITFQDGLGYVQYYRYRPDGGAPDDWIEVYPNASGEASVSVAPGAWDVQKVCEKLRWNGQPRTVSSTVTVVKNGNASWTTSSNCPVP